MNSKMEKELTLDELTPENVTGLTEEEAFMLLNKVICELPREKRPYYENIISSAFEFRSISTKNKKLRGDLTMYGYAFFKIPHNDSLIMGMRRKSARR
jgi:hypothetical protein